MKRPPVLLAIALLLLVLAMVAKPLLLGLPDVPAQPSPGSFDTQRAIARLARILGDQRPHPVDSDANDAVRSRLVTEIERLGLHPVISDGLTCNADRRSRSAGCARIRNVRATIGPTGGRQVLIASHYDSTPVGPGAADDGVGIAVSLELAALLKDRPLARPVTFLFDEGEELELNGARAFLDRDPLAGRVDSLINLEARGDTGPAIMFETSRPNAPAIALLRAAAWHPVANSLTADFYSLIPNDTDVSVFKSRPWTILNFALIGHESRYHSPDDDIGSLDPRSVRHMGEQVLRAASTMVVAAPQKPGSRLYADVLGRGLVSVPAVIGLGWLVLLLAGAAFLSRQGGKPVAWALASVAAALAGSAAASWLLQSLVGLVRHGAFWRAHPQLIAGAVDLSALAASLSLLAWLGRGCTADALRRAFWLLFLLVGSGMCLLAPGAAIFFLFPATVALFALLLRSALAAWLAWLLLFLSWAPLLHLSEMLLDFDAAWIFALVSAMILAPPLIELRGMFGEAALRRPSAPAAALALAAWAALLVTPAYSAARKQPFVIEYARDRSSARWLIENDGARLPHGLTGFTYGVKTSWSRRLRWAAPAPLLHVPAPSLEPIGMRQHALGRMVRLRLHAAGSDALMLRTDGSAPILAARAGGSLARFASGKAGEPSRLRCNGRSCDRLVIDLLVGSRRPVAARLIGFRYALPAEARPLIETRPLDAASHYLPDATVSVANVKL